MRRAVFLVIVALGLGGFVGYGIYVYLQQAEQRALSGYALVDVLVSQGAIPEGTSLAVAVAEGLAAPAPFPEDFVPGNALAGVTADRADLVTIDELAAGQILLTGDFVPAPDAPRLLDIPEGMAALSLALPEQARLGPFLQPGDRVAVLATSTRTGGTGAEVITRVVIPDVEVLAVGDTTSGATPIVGQGTSDGLVTLAVNPRDVPSLAHAASTSSVYLSMLGSDGVVDPGATANGS